MEEIITENPTQEQLDLLKSWGWNHSYRCIFEKDCVIYNLKNENIYELDAKLASWDLDIVDCLIRTDGFPASC
jgi:hypothetical protein